MGITPAQTLSAVQTLSGKVGKSHLMLVSVVGEEPNQPPWGLTNVNWSNKTQVSMLKSYVKSLKSYAKGEYARLDFEEFNSTSSTTINSQVSDFVSKLGVNGFWFDHGPNLYNTIGQNAFNHMMQALATSFPSVTFLVNDAVGCPAGLKCTNGGWITPLTNDTWQKQSYISPSLQTNTYNQLNTNTMKSLSAIWTCSCSTEGEGMILHFDAYSQVSTEPMGVFAAQSSSVEESAIQTLTNMGIPGRSGYSGYSYYLMYPMLGAATFDGKLSGSPNYEGTMYNSLTSGTYARSTIASFTTTMAGT